MTSTSQAPLPESQKEPADPASGLAIDYSQLRIGENKSFMDAWDEAFKWNDEATRVKGEDVTSQINNKNKQDPKFRTNKNFLTFLHY